MIGYKSVSKFSAILVSFYPDVVTTDDDIAALGSILSNFPCLL